MPTPLSGSQLVCLLISFFPSGVLSLQCKADECQDPAIGSLAVVWLLTEGETAYSDFPCAFDGLHTSREMLAGGPFSLSVVFSLDSFCFSDVLLFLVRGREMPLCFRRVFDKGWPIAYLR